MTSLAPLPPSSTVKPASSQPVAGSFKLLIWSVIPTHHQSSFFAALRADGFDVVVHYYRRLESLQHRVRLGWSAPASMPEGERYVPESLKALDLCADWSRRIHIVPGYGSAFLLRLAVALSFRGVRWLHWGEPSEPKRHSAYLRPVKRIYFSGLVRHFASGALAIGERARAEFESLGVPGQRVCFLPYAVPAVATIPRQLSIARVAGQVRFLFLGALIPRKGVDVLLQAFCTVWGAFPAARLMIVGADESGGAYRRLVNHLGLDAAVQMSPSIPPAQIGTALDACDVFVLPSRFDGWGVALNEAASAGKALISTDSTGAAHHLIVPGVNGFRVPAGESAALAQAMLAYCRDPHLVLMHGTESRRIFADFTPEVNARRLRLGLESLLSPSPTVCDL